VAVCELDDSSTEVIVNCRNQAITLIDPVRGVLSVMAIYRQLRTKSDDEDGALRVLPCLEYRREPEREAP